MMIANKLQNKILRIANNLFELPKGRCKHFSFLLSGNKIVSMGWNNTNKTHPMAQRFKYPFATIHSELHCVINSNIPVGEIYRHIMVNVRVSRDGLQMSRPCVICQNMLTSFGLLKVIYTTKNGWLQLNIKD